LKECGAVEGQGPPKWGLVLRYISRHWAGHHSLPHSLFINLLAPVLLIYLLNDALDFALANVPDTVLVIRLWFAALFVLLVFLVWGATGAWKSATRVFRRRDGGAFHKLARWSSAELAQVSIFFLALFYTFSLTVFLPTYSTLVQIARGQDPLSQYVLEWGDEERTWIYFGGTIGFGLNDQLKAMLKEPNQATYIQLESDGGRELEAEKTARTIEAAGLSTYTQFQCVSACTLMFLAGKDRTLDLEDGARIGFHSPYLTTMMGDTSVGGLTSEYYRHLVNRNVSEKFAAWAIRVPPDDMWFPTPQILKEEGIVTQFYVDEEAGTVPVDAYLFDDAFYTLAEAEAIFLEVDKITQQVEDLQEVIDINKQALATGWLSLADQTNAHFRIGISHRFQDEYNDAILAFRAADQLRPDYTPVLYQRALTYGDWYWATRDPIRLRQALNDLSRLVQMEPDNGEVRSTRGMFYVEAKEFDKAEEDFDQSVILAPFDSAIANNSCWFKITELGQYDTALADCNKALELEPDSDAALHSRGLTYDILGKRELAIADYQKAYEIAPERQAISRDSIAYLDALESDVDAVSAITGVWAADPSLPALQKFNSCDENALRISVDMAAGLYRAVNVTNGFEIRAKLLSADGNRFQIQYADEERLDDAGNPVSWHLVMLDADRFFWVRDDDYLRVDGRLIFQGKNTEIRTRCTSVS